MSALELTPLDPAERDVFLRICVQSFGGMDDHSRWGEFLDLIGIEHARMLRRDGRIVAGLVIHDMGQFFAGRSLRMGGYAGVAVPPEERGAGVATELMRRSLRELRAQGVPLSALYASTQVLYRRVGFEQAGAAYRYTLPVERVGLRERDLPARPLATDPRGELVRALYRRRAVATPGHLDRNDCMWTRVFRVVDNRPVSAWVVGPEDDPEGYVVVTQRSGQKLWVRDFVAHTPRAARRIWTLLASHSTLWKEILWTGPAVDPLLCHLPEQHASIETPERWMLRIVDVPEALAGRGYPADVSAALHLEISDEVLPENAGRFVLSVEGGQPSVEPGGEGHLRLDVRALAPLYSGLFSAWELQDLGWLSASHQPALEAATRLFAGPAPWMPDHF